MTSKQMERLANDMKMPELKEVEVAKLLNREDFSFMPIQDEGAAFKSTPQSTSHSVAQAKPRSVAPTKPRSVAQTKSRAVAPTKPRSVAQTKSRAVAQTKPRSVAQTKPQSVAQTKPRLVAQTKPQSVAQPVAQGPWVAQKVAQPVAQSEPQRVAQPVAQKVAQVPTELKVYQTQADKDIEHYKEQICQMHTIEERKRYCLDIGFSIKPELRGKTHYLYGIKKLEGKKYRLYIGNASSV